mmetsp:Transcript_160/g.608  ORF Transcript_160/g.608 Transcript_160/m.608 type:complete len:210 (-) Transcript_160:2106-2735(-)
MKRRRRGHALFRGVASSSESTSSARLLSRSSFRSISSTRRVLLCASRLRTTLSPPPSPVASPAAALVPFASASASGAPSPSSSPREESFFFSWSISPASASICAAVLWLASPSPTSTGGGVHVKTTHTIHRGGFFPLLAYEWYVSSTSAYALTSTETATTTNTSASKTSTSFVSFSATSNAMESHTTKNRQHNSVASSKSMCSSLNGCA